MLSIKKRIAGSFAACFFLLSVGFATLHAQNAQLSAIDASLLAMRDVDDRCGDELSDFCGYYLNYINVNGYGAPWPDVGSYYSSQQFCYEFVDGEEGTEMILRYVHIETKRSNQREIEEYLFDQKGSLQMYGFSLVGDQLLQEYGYYFESAELLKYNELVLPEEVEFQKYHKADAALVRKEAADVVAVFRSTFR